MISEKMARRLRKQTKLPPCDKDTVLAVHKAQNRNPSTRCERCGRTIGEIEKAIDAFAQKNLPKKYGGENEE